MRLGLVQRVQGGYTDDGGYALTTDGRDFCIAEKF
jgi:hypothetical protein